MAEIIKQNVKMRLILPENDQETFVNAINYNFHQLANIANGVVAKQGEKGDQGYPGNDGKQGEKGETGNGIYAYTGDNSATSYESFIESNGINEGDYILNGGKIYTYNSSYTSITDYNDEDVASDLVSSIDESVKKYIEDANSNFSIVGTSQSYALIPKTLYEIDNKKYYDCENKLYSLPILAVSGLTDKDSADVLPVVNDSNFFNYSINSMIKDDSYYNVRLSSSNNWNNCSKIKFNQLTTQNILEFDFDSESDSASIYRLNSYYNGNKYITEIGSYDNSDDILSCISIKNSENDYLMMSLNSSSATISTLYDTFNVLNLKDKGLINIKGSTGGSINIIQDISSILVSDNDINISRNSSFIRMFDGSFSYSSGATQPVAPKIYLSSTYFEGYSEYGIKLTSNNIHIGRGLGGKRYGIFCYTPSTDANKISYISLTSAYIKIFNTSNVLKNSAIYNRSYNSNAMKNESTDFGISSSDTDDRLYILSNTDIHIASTSDTSIYAKDLVSISDSMCENYLNTYTRIGYVTPKDVFAYYKLPYITGSNWYDFVKFLNSEGATDEQISIYEACIFSEYDNTMKCIINGNKTSYYPVPDSNYIDFSFGFYTYGNSVIIDIRYAKCVSKSSSVKAEVFLNIEGFAFLKAYNEYLSSYSGQYLAAMKYAYYNTEWFRIHRPGKIWSSVIKSDGTYTNNTAFAKIGYYDYNSNTDTHDYQKTYNKWAFSICLDDIEKTDGNYSGQIVFFVQ